MKSPNRCAIMYAAIEFMPMTTSGNDHFFQPATSTSA